MAHTMAMLMATKKGRKFKVTDFLLRWAAPKRRQSPEEMLELFRKLAESQKDRS